MLCTEWKRQIIIIQQFHNTKSCFSLSKIKALLNSLGIPVDRDYKLQQIVHSNINFGLYITIDSNAI